LNSNWTLDTSFNNGWAGFAFSTAETNVNNVYLQPDGKIFVVWHFTSYNGANQKFVIRLNSDGTEDTSFNSAWTGFVWDNVWWATVQSDWKYIVWWRFTSYNWVAVGNIARLNTDWTLDTTYNSTCSSWVSWTPSWTCWTWYTLTWDTNGNGTPNCQPNINILIDDSWDWTKDCWW
jgi:hypothetical protein